MSKIALTPNATGTGVFTISSPATNTDRTLTLPDITGTLVSTDASGNVGIGTSSPDVNLDVTKTSDGIAARFQRSSGGGIVDIETYNGIGGIGTSDNIPFRLNTNNTERMRIDSSGKVGIGTSSPNATLTVSQSSNNIFAVERTGVTGSGQFGINIETNSQATVSYDDGAQLVFGTASNPSIHTGFTERMRLNSSGQLYVGGATPAFPSKLSILNGASVGPAFSVECTHTTPYGAVQFQNGNGTVGSISVYSTSVAYNTSSDYRLKEDDVPMTGATERVKALRPINFAWKSDGSRVDGFLAHELADVVPEAVTGTKDAMRDEEYEVTAAVYEDIIIAAVLDEEGNELEAERTEQRLVTEAVMGTRSVPDMQGIDQSKLVPLLTAALQEALNKIDAMEIRLAALEAV